MAVSRTTPADDRQSGDRAGDAAWTAPTEPTKHAERLERAQQPGPEDAASTADDAGPLAGTGSAAGQRAHRTVPIEPRYREPAHLADLVTERIPRRPAGGRPGPGGAAASVFAAASATSCWAAVVSFSPVLALVLVGWLVDGRAAASPVNAVRFAAAVWLLGHGVPLGTSSGSFALVPLGLTALIGWRLFRAGAHSARAIRGGDGAPVLVAAAITFVYGLLGAGTAFAASTSGLTISPIRALLDTAGLAAVASLAGAAGQTGAAGVVWQRLPDWVRTGLRGGGLAAAGIVASGAVVAGAALALTGDRAVDILRSYHAGVAGIAGMTLLCLLYTPTLSVWSASYLVGPGFSIGVGTAVSPGQVRLGPVPALPLLSGLPTTVASPLVDLLLGVPVAAGLLAGVLIARRLTMAGWLELLGATGLAGVGAGALLGVAGLAAHGALAGGRLAEVGPVWWRLALMGAALVGVAAAVAGAGARAVVAVRR